MGYTVHRDTLYYMENADVQDIVGSTVRIDTIIAWLSVVVTLLIYYLVVTTELVTLFS